jgi:hypothetical protein
MGRRLKNRNNRSMFAGRSPWTSIVGEMPDPARGHLLGPEIDSRIGSTADCPQAGVKSVSRLFNFIHNLINRQLGAVTPRFREQKGELKDPTPKFGL